MQRDLRAKVLGHLAAKSSAIRGVHRPLSFITASGAGCCSSQSLPAFHCGRAARCLLKFLSISGCRGATGTLNIPASEHWAELEHLAQCFGTLVTRLVGWERVCGVPEDGSCRQLKAASVPGVAQFLCVTWATAAAGGDGKGRSVLLGKRFPRVLLCHCINSCYRR